jgi:hypothetical protein
MMPPPQEEVSTLRYILETHGFGAFVALLLLYLIYSYAPAITSANTALAKHLERDANREAILLALCLNSSHTPDETQRCWTALISGTIPAGGHP